METCVTWRKSSNHGLSNAIQENPGCSIFSPINGIARRKSGALLLGVDETGYVPSKLATYALSGKPLLACVRRNGHAYIHLRGLRSWAEYCGSDDS